MFALAIEFLTGRYVATAFNDRGRAEWPPHPARVFSALVATHFEEPEPAARAALEWLEQQGPPALLASEAFEREVHTVFVPVNDQAGEPDYRVRQARTFPSVTPDQPRVVFIWPDAAPSLATASAIDQLASRVVRLGHSSSLVSVRVLEGPVEPNWQPGDRGHLRLRVVGPGQLEDLERRFAIHRETEPRVMPAAFQLYGSRPSGHEPTRATSVFSGDWLIFRRVAGPALPMVSAAGVARGVRKVLLSMFGEAPIPEVISGHRADRSPSDGSHLAIVPLPFVGHVHADGALQGVALVVPRAAGEQDRRALFAGVARWEASVRRETAGVPEDTPVLPVHLGAAGILSLMRLDASVVPHTLRASTWCRASRRWVTATPVALDRNPGDLRSRDRRRLDQAVAEAEDVVRSACQHVGLPSPSMVAILPGVPLAGVAKARHFPPFPGGEGRVQRVLVHLAIEFAEPVAGPVLLGAGRYVGLGLLRPVDHD